MQLNESSRRAYDHRIREHIYRRRNPNLFPELRWSRHPTQKPWDYNECCTCTRWAL